MALFARFISLGVLINLATNRAINFPCYVSFNRLAGGRKRRCKTESAMSTSRTLSRDLANLR